MAEVQRYDTGTSSWVTVDNARWRIENGISTKLPAPRATIELGANADISANDEIRVVDGSTVLFDGFARTGGEYGESGSLRVELRDDAYKILDEEVSVSLTSTTDEQVISTALSNTELGGNWTFTYHPSSANSIGDYSVTDRPFKVILKDIIDRTGLVWRFTADRTLNVGQLGRRGTWKSLSTGADDINIPIWNDGDIATVQNEVTVQGTGNDPVSGTATNSTSISEYGRQSVTYSYRWIRSATEASNTATELLIPDPLKSGKVVASETVGGIYANLANYNVTLSDSTRDINSEVVAVEKQVLQEGRTTLSMGQGAGYGEAQINRESQSRADDIRQEFSQLDGEVVNGDLSDDSVDTPQLVDTAVINSKLAAASVDSGELVDLSVVESKLDDLAVSLNKVQDDAIDTVKITDDAIETPKIAAGAVTASEILADTITANEIASGTITATEIDAGTITANEIASNTITAGEITSGTITATEMAADTITANEIDTLDLEAGELTIGDQSLGARWEFATNSDEVIMIPANTSAATIGTTNFPVTTIWNEDLIGKTAEWLPSASTTGKIVIKDDGGNITFQPVNDTENRVGTIDNAWDTMRATAFNVASPKPLAQRDIEDLGETVADGGKGERPVDLDELKSSTWYDPPQYIQDEQQRNLEKQERGDEEDHAVELGHMGNYLFEVTKALAEERDELANRVDTLESRLSKLEARVGE